MGKQGRPKQSANILDTQ